jgi:hypothetical protein
LFHVRSDAFEFESISENNGTQAMTEEPHVFDGASTPKRSRAHPKAALSIASVMAWLIFAGCSRQEQPVFIDMDFVEDMREVEEVDQDLFDLGRQDLDESMVKDLGVDMAPALTTCATLFGAPNENTGLDQTQCSPVCQDCDDGFMHVAGAIDEATLERWRQLEHASPFSELTEDPYQGSSPAPAAPGSVCAVQFVDQTSYELVDYPSRQEAEAAGAIPTHAGECGLCSSLSNLAVYAGNGDLTSPVRECGLVGVRDGDQANIDCLLELGFDLPCAQIWFYNTRYTRTKCGRPCFAALGDPYHFPDGTLNDCLQCDEDNAGPVFKKFAGRTRRNSGLATAICRPCEGLFATDHRYR